MRHHYPKGSEHERIWEDIQIQYFVEVDRELDPLYEVGWEALRARDIDRRTDIDWLIREKQMELCQRRWRREEILNWLYLDSELRKEGKTYPDVYEMPREVVVCSGEF